MLAETLKHDEVDTRRVSAKKARSEHSTVRSIQRLPPMPDHDSPFIAKEYMDWLPHYFRTVIRVHREEGAPPRVDFTLGFLKKPLLVLELIDHGGDRSREKFHIVGGFLSKTTTTGWLEFRQVAHRRFTLAAIHGFVPALPWLIYVWSQAPVHAWVMHAYGRHLERVKARPPSS